MSESENSVQKLKIVHVVRQFAPAIGGLENFVAQLAMRQAATGHDVRVVTLDRVFAQENMKKLSATENYFGVEVVRIPFVGSTRYPIAPKVKELVNNFDIIHVHSVDFFCDYLASIKYSHKTPMVLSTHGGFFHTKFARVLKNLFFNIVTRRTLWSFETVLACSENDAAKFKQIAAKKVQLIENPVDIEKFAGMANRQSKQIIYFGRFSTNKRIENLLTWFRDLRVSDPSWCLCITGREMDVTRHELGSHAIRLGVDEHVRIVASPTDEELKALIGESSAFCSSSAYEGFGMAAIEAASAGLFPVLSDIPPHRAHVEALGFGLIVDFEEEAKRRGSIAAFLDGIATFHRNMSLPKVMQAVQPYSWERASEKFERAYQAALSGAKCL